MDSVVFRVDFKIALGMGADRTTLRSLACLRYQMRACDACISYSSSIIDCGVPRDHNIFINT